MRRAALLVLALGAPSCSDGQSNLVPSSEAFTVRGAQFVRGSLPGTPPLPPSAPAFEPGDPPRIINFQIQTSLTVTQGQAGKKLPAFLTTNAASVGLALEGVSTGFWVLPTGDIDTTSGTPRLTLNATADFGDTVPVGNTHIVGVALDANGVAGPQYQQHICIAGAGPAGASQCPDGAPAPAAAITLTWDTQVDLDLQVMTPDGKLVTSKHPYIDDPDKKQPADPSKPHIDRDSNPNCALDGVRRESLIWPTDPADPAGSEMPSGVYGVYVNLYSACKEQAVHFHVQVMTAVPGPPDADAGAAGAGGDDANTRVEQVWLDKSGELIAVQASPTAPTGLFVTEFNFQ